VSPQAGREVDIEFGYVKPIDYVSQRVREQSGMLERVVFADDRELEERVHIAGGQGLNKQFFAISFRTSGTDENEQKP
jgi:hypothetical protein